jgi:hypothetical protein
MARPSAPLGLQMSARGFLYCRRHRGLAGLGEHIAAAAHLI